MVIQQGTHTLSVYFTPRDVDHLLGTLENSHSGLTFVFELDTLDLIDTFQQEGDYTNEQLANLQVEAITILERTDEGRTGNRS